MNRVMEKIIIVGIVALMVGGSFMVRISFANHEFNKKVDLGELQKELIAGGCQVDYIETRGTSGEVIGPDCPAATAIIAGHDAMKEPNRKAAAETRLRDLRGLTKGVGLSDAERDEAIGLLIDEALGKD